VCEVQIQAIRKMWPVLPYHSIFLIPKKRGLLQIHKQVTVYPAMFEETYGLICTGKAHSLSRFARSSFAARVKGGAALSRHRWGGGWTFVDGSPIFISEALPGAKRKYGFMLHSNHTGFVGDPHVAGLNHDGEGQKRPIACWDRSRRSMRGRH